MIVTIDGPAGAGKSSAARALARRLAFRFLDTGAMYRAVAFAALRRGLAWSDPAELAELARQLKIEVSDNRVLLDGEDVTETIRTVAVTTATHYAANNPAVREHLVGLQRRAAGHDHVVTEGRDQGTVVFPHAQCKIFLTASPHVRAKRRLLDLTQRGEQMTFEEVLEQQNVRDERDLARSVGPLKPAADAVLVSTDGLEPAEVVDRLEALVRARMGEA
jgi:cytidylate kinase